MFCVFAKMWPDIVPFSFTKSQVFFCCPPRLGLCCCSHGNRLNGVWLMIVGVVRLYPYFLPSNSYKHEDTCCNYVSVCVFICLEPLPLNYYIDRKLFYGAVVYSFFLFFFFLEVFLTSKRVRYGHNLPSYLFHIHS